MKAPMVAVLGDASFRPRLSHLTGTTADIWGSAPSCQAAELQLASKGRSSSDRKCIATCCPQIQLTEVRRLSPIRRQTPQRQYKWLTTEAQENGVAEPKRWRAFLSHGSPQRGLRNGDSK